MSSEWEQRSFKDAGSSPDEAYDAAATGWSTPRDARIAERPAPVSRPSGAARTPVMQHTHADESPELLRWRAELLLDEMMLGGVDVSAADSGPNVYTPAPARPPAPREQASTSGAAPQSASPATRPPMPSSMPASLASAYPDLDAPATKPWDDGSGTPAARPLPPVVSPATGSEAQTRSERLTSLEQRYAQYRREQESTIQPAPPKATPTMSDPEPPRTPNPKPTPPPDDATHWAESPEKWLRQDFSPPPEPPVAPSPAFYEAAAAFERPDYGDAAVRQDPAHFVNAMSVMNSKKRSNLLPRMSTLNADELNREIAALHAEIAELLPEGQESGERARHLLDKAHTILNSDPMRSAEVEYYMQQVRTIVQRRRQALAWSDLYRSRLRVYLTGWFGLSLMVLLARYFFQVQFEAFALWLFGFAADGVAARHWAAFIGAGAAGAMGGAAGALYTMLQQTQTVQVLFDRKYGLRGLMLPIIGLAVGLIGYPLFGVAFGMAGLNPAANLLIGTLPALAAFAFGFAQESIYGTRD